MSSTTHYVPHSEQTRQHYERFLRDLRRWLPPGLDDSISEIAEEALSIVCRAGGQAGAQQQHQQQQQLKKQLELLFDTPLTAEALHEVLQYGRLIDDFVVTDEDAGEVPNRPNNTNSTIPSHTTLGPDSGLNDGLGGLLFQDDGASSSSEVEADASRRDLMKFAADYVDETGIATAADGAYMNNVEDEDGLDGELATGLVTTHVSFEEVACNPNYVRDTLRRLFPTQTVETCEVQAARAVEYMSQPQVDQLTLETQLTAFLGGYDDDDVMEWIGTAAASRWAIVYGLRFAGCHNQTEREAVFDAMRTHAQRDRAVERLYQSVTGKEVQSGVAGLGGDGDDDDKGEGRRPLRRVDLQAYTFKDERAPHQHTRAVVPQGTQRIVFETHDEIVLPPSQSYAGEDTLTSVTAFPEWAQPAFPGVVQLNPMQSRVFNCAFCSDENMLISAPTGAGKTNVAMMAMLRAVANTKGGHHQQGGLSQLRELKMVYVAPMKALVQEVVRTFSARLEPLGLTVVELSGDSSLSQSQLATAQLIVVTPEKWDVVTRKSVDLGVASMLRLLILDEVHLLHNERGPVLEAIVARTMLQQSRLAESEGSIRIVGLSATLPNYTDVASFLQVDRQRGLFVFDSSFRPIPLQQSFCAVKKVRGTNHAAVMNLVAYDKVLQTAMAGEQSMVFVHSRKDTEYTASFMMRRVTEEKRGHHFVRPSSESEQTLREAAASGGLRSSLQQLLPMGFAIHHAGLSREERSTVEELFATRHIRVLVCTSTLAWGVNLPANHVIIKGTRVFNGARGEMELLSALDVLQMFGRAGRLGFGSAIGRAAVITSPDDLQYYLGVLNNQLPIESQMMKRIVDMLNAEITLGHVENITEGVRWLQRTYLYVRMRHSPEMYGTRPSSSDPLYLRHLENIVHTAADDLRRCQMAEYDTNARRIASTPYGRIASYFYITATSMATYLTHLRSTMHDVDLFRLFAMSKEFAHVAVRPEEQAQLQYLLENAPIAVRESRYTPLAKINILLQCYISDMTLQGLPLMSELVYVKDSAQRILRALHEVCLVRGYGRTARQVLELCLMVVHQQWAVQSPARQLRHTVAPKMFAAFIQTLESRRVSWAEVRQWSIEDLTEKLGDERRATAALECIRMVPHFTLEAAVRPLTRSMLYVDVDITPDFVYNMEHHGTSVGELLLTVEHTNGRILHHERVYISESLLRQGETYAAPTIVVPILDPKPTHYFVRSQSINWLGTDCSVAVCLMNLRLPDVAPPLLELHDHSMDASEEAREVSTALQPYGLASAASKVFGFDTFLPAQYDMIVPLMEAPSESLLVAMPPGGGKTVIAELFALQFLFESHVSNNVGMGRKLLYITPYPMCAQRRYHEWRFKFGESLGRRVILLRPSGENIETTIRRVSSADIIITCGAALSPLVHQHCMNGNKNDKRNHTNMSTDHTQGSNINDVDNDNHHSGSEVHNKKDYDLMTTGCLAAVTHIVVDQLHLLRAPEGRRVEECLARLRPFALRGDMVAPPARLLALSYPLISTAELGRWLRIPAGRQLNFGASHRQLRVRLESLDVMGSRGRREAAAAAVVRWLQREPYMSTPSVIFVPAASEAEELAKRLLLRCRDFVPDVEGLAEDVEDRRLALLLSAGIAYMHRGTSLLDELAITSCVDSHPARHPSSGASLPLVLVCTFDAAWRLPAALFATAFVCPAERPGSFEADANEGGGGDCAVSELLHMASRGLNEAVVCCRPARRWVWSRLLNDPLPLESHLRYPEDFRDTLNSAIAEGRAHDMPSVLRVLQSHYFLFHLRSNPHFYGVPAREDIPAYASDFARAVVTSLRAAGCVESDGEELESEMVSLRPSRRGLAAAHHGIAISSLETLAEAVEGAGGDTLSIVGMWRLVAASCAELSVDGIGDAARIADAAERRALQTIARAFPDVYGVRYVDVDFHASSTKVYLLLMAYCARMFATDPHLHDVLHDSNKYGHNHHIQHSDQHKKYHSDHNSNPDNTNTNREDEEGMDELVDDEVVSLTEMPHLQCHPFDTPASMATDRPLLLNIPLPVASRLRDDLEALLPAALSTLRGACELLPPTHWLQARYLMRLSAQVERRMWGFESPLLQLPCVQASPAARAVLEADDWTLERLSALREADWAHLVHSFVERGVVARLAAAEAMVHRLRMEALAVPRVVRFGATGSVAVDPNGSALFAVNVKARLACHAAPGRWWVACAARRVGGTERLLAMRLVTPTRDASNAIQGTKEEEGEEERLGEWALEGVLRFPLSEVDGEDLDALKMVATIVAQRFRADAEVEVTFEEE